MNQDYNVLLFLTSALGVLPNWNPFPAEFTLWGNLSLEGQIAPTN